MIKRFRSAFRTNEPQMTTLIACTGLNLMACGLREQSTPLWFWIAAGMFWPVFVFIMNFFDPIPENKI